MRFIFRCAYVEIESRSIFKMQDKIDSILTFHFLPLLVDIVHHTIPHDKIDAHHTLVTLVLNSSLLFHHYAMFVL